MAPKPQKREYSAAELAMLDDIGAGRVDELPLEDSGTVPRDGAAQTSIESGRTGTRNTWNEAIARGHFEDEDAAVVAGQRELANGQLARMRRAADLSFMAVNRNFGYNDRRLRKDHNGQVAPRAQFSRGKRGPAQAGLAHTGDGPVELRTATRSSHHPPPHTPVATITPQRPIDPKWNAKLLLETSSPSSPAAQPLNGAPSTAQPAGVPIQSSGPQSITFSLQLPEGYSVLFQATVTFASPTFINRTGEYPGTIYLVNGPSPVDDQIILHIDEARVEDVKRRTKEYVDYLSDSDRLILQFKDDSSNMTWFVVIFRQRDVMVSFVDALRDFVDRLKKPSPSPASTQIRRPTVNTPAVSTERHRNTSAPIIESPLQHDTKIVSVAILEDIVSWAIHIVAFIRDAGPTELANADALPGIIRGASAAVLMEKHAGFSDLESKQRVAFVDEVCVPKVFERFQRRLMEEEAKKRPAKSVSTTTPSSQTSSKEHKTTPRRWPTYTIDKLIQLESTAIDPPDWLTELKYLPEMNPENRVRIKDIIQRAHKIHSSSAPTQTAQVPKAEYGPDGNISPGSARGAGSPRSDAVVVRTAPSITVTAPSGMPNPEEPLVSIHGEMNGLNSSRHNMNGIDILGHSAGQFTGALSRDKSHLEDLMLLDRVEDFELIRAHDPEVAKIADRFAQIHFDEGGPN